MEVGLWPWLVPKLLCGPQLTTFLQVSVPIANHPPAGQRNARLTSAYRDEVGGRGVCREASGLPTGDAGTRTQGHSNPGLGIWDSDTQCVWGQSPGLSRGGVMCRCQGCALNGREHSVDVSCPPGSSASPHPGGRESGGLPTAPQYKMPTFATPPSNHPFPA